MGLKKTTDFMKYIPEILCRGLGLFWGLLKVLRTFRTENLFMSTEPFHVVLKRAEEQAWVLDLMYLSFRNRYLTEITDRLLQGKRSAPA